MTTTNKRNELLNTVVKFPRRTAKEYATLVGRPSPSVRRDLTQLVRSNDLRRVTESGSLQWEPVRLTA